MIVYTDEPAAGDRRFAKNNAILNPTVGRQSLVIAHGYSADGCRIVLTRGNPIFKSEFIKNTNILNVSGTQDYNKNCCTLVRLSFVFARAPEYSKEYCMIVRTGTPSVSDHR